MSDYPMVDAVLDRDDEAAPLFCTLKERFDFITELRALRARVPQPTRKLREVKGVVYRDGKWWLRDSAFHSVANLLFFRHESFTDADHAAIYALKDDPYEPVETVDDVLDSVFAAQKGTVWWHHKGTPYFKNIAARLRAAVLAEQGEP